MIMNIHPCSYCPFDWYCHLSDEEKLKQKCYQKILKEINNNKNIKK